MSINKINGKDLEFGNIDQIKYLKKHEITDDVITDEDDDPIGSIEETEITVYGYDIKCVKCKRNIYDECLDEQPKIITCYHCQCKYTVEIDGDIYLSNK